MKINLTNLETTVRRTRIKDIDPNKTTEENIPIPKDVIKLPVIRKAHTLYQVIHDGKRIDVEAVLYTPRIIFSTMENDYWEYPKPSIINNKEQVSQLCKYWDYLYEGLEVYGRVKDGVFKLDLRLLTKQLDKIHTQYLKKQEELNRLDRLDKLDMLARAMKGL